MTVHSVLTGNPFTIDADSITIIWPAMGLEGLEGTEVSRDGDKITCLENLDEMQALLKAEGLKFAKVQHLKYDWAFCLINTDKIRYLEAKTVIESASKEATKIQIGFDYDGEILVDLPLEQTLDLLTAARR